MFRSKAHQLMLTNLKFLELQDKLLNRFQIFKNEEIRILKKENMKLILHEWAKELTQQNQKVNLIYIPKKVLENKVVEDILKNDIECRWLVRRITLGNSDDSMLLTNNIPSILNTKELQRRDELFFDEYPELFYYEYPQYPYNYYNKKKMTQLYSLIKFPYNDIMNISKKIQRSLPSPESENYKIEEKEKLTTKETTTTNVVDEYNMNYSENNYIYSPSEMETAKEKHS